MEATNHLKTLVGRWKVIALCGLLGLAAGGISIPAKSQRTSQGRASGFTATHFLIAEPADGNAKVVTLENLDLVVLLATVGDVPRRVAEALAMPADVVTRQVRATADSGVGVIRLTATATDPATAVVLANTVAKELQAVLLEQKKKRHDADVAEVTALMKDLQRQIDVASAAIARQPFTADGRSQIQDPVLNAQREALVKRLEAAKTDLQSIDAKGPPTSGFSTLEEAKPVVLGGASPVPQGATPKGKAADSSSAAATTIAPSVNAPAAPSRLASRPIRVLLSGLAGLALGAGFALLRERIDTRIRSRAIAERSFALPVIGEIPKRGRSRKRKNRAVVAVASEPLTLEAESYRLLRTVLTRTNGMLHDSHEAEGGLEPGLHGIGDASSGQPGQPSQRLPPKRIMVTSPDERDGKSTVALNLAAAFAESGSSVLLMDLDLRRSRMSAYLGRPASNSLTELLEPDAAVTLDDVIVSSGLRGVEAALSREPAGHPSRLMARARHILSEASEKAEVVIVDTPPVLPVSDASDLASAVDAIVVVSRMNKTSVAAAVRTSEVLARIEAPTVGVVLLAAPALHSTRAYFPYRPGRKDRRPQERRGSGSPPFVEVATEPRQPRSEDAETVRTTSDEAAHSEIGSAEPAFVAPAPPETASNEDIGAGGRAPAGEFRPTEGNATERVSAEGGTALPVRREEAASNGSNGAGARRLVGPPPPPNEAAAVSAAKDQSPPPKRRRRATTKKEVVAGAPSAGTSPEPRDDVEARL